MQGTIDSVVNPSSLVPDFQPNERIRLLAASPIHRGLYESIVLGVQPGGLRVSLPEEQGRFVFIPVGTTVQLFRADQDHAEASWIVSDREGGPRRSLLLVPPRLWQEAQSPLAPRSRVVAISSGKGGVGKSVLALNLALALSDLGRRVCLVDADLGTANLDVLLNFTPRLGLESVVRGQCTLGEILIPGPHGITLLPGASAAADLADLDEPQLRQLYAQLAPVDALADLILIDTGAGLSRRVTTFLLAAGETLLLTTPEPHAITDAYALLKVLAGRQYRGDIHLVVAMTKSRDQAEAVAKRMIFASDHFLGLPMDYLGPFPWDAAVPSSVGEQQPLLLRTPNARAALAIRDLAARLLNIPPSAEMPRGLRRLFQYLHLTGLTAASGG